MKIQYLNGGLANQVFQYIFAQHAQLSTQDSEPWFFDDSFFFLNNVHNGYELEKVFGLKLNLLSSAFDQDVWEELIENKKRGISIPQSFKSLGFDIKMIAEFDNFREHNPFDGQVYRVPGNQFLPEITNTGKEDIYYHGYWLHPKWFLTYKDFFREKLSFAPITDAHNLTYQAKIFNSTSVAIHIRRGDFVAIGWDTDSNFYYEKLTEIISRYKDASFFVFSDDIPWCKEHAAELGLHLARETTYIEGNTLGRNYIDLQLMSMCRIMLTGKSSFSHLAFLLNNRVEYIVSERFK